MSTSLSLTAQSLRHTLGLVVLLTTAHALPNPNGSNYFVGLFDIIGGKIGVAYPPGYCVKQGLIVEYVKFVCSADYNSITKYTYTGGNDECTGAASKTKTFTYTSDIVSGYLHDFNCAGKENVMGYETYLTGCESTKWAGTAWMAIGVCHWYKNGTEIKGNTVHHQDIPQDQYFMMTGTNQCEGCTLYQDVFVPWRDRDTTYSAGDDMICGGDTPVSQFDADPGCDLYLDESGFKMFADAVACIHDGVDQFTVENGTCTYERPTTTFSTTDESEDIASHIHCTVGLVVWIMMLLCVNC
eukprot:147583_1